MKKKLFISILIVLTAFSADFCFAKEPSIEEQKKAIVAMYNSNNLKEAYNMISKIMEEDRDAELWYLLANLSQDMGNDNNAEFFLRKSISLNPEFDKAYYNLGNIYLKQKKYNKAITEYKLAIKYKKDFAFYYYNLGCAYIEQRNYDGAKVALKKAIKLKNNEPSFHYNLALTYKNLGNEKAAKEELDLYNKMQ